jgi:hypothetical protein
MNHAVRETGFPANFLLQNDAAIHFPGFRTGFPDRGALRRIVPVRSDRRLQRALGTGDRTFRHRMDLEGNRHADRHPTDRRKVRAR